MHQPPPNIGPAAFIVPLLAMGLIILRNSRARRLRIETLWIAPLLIVALVGLSFLQPGMQLTPLAMGASAAALIVGAVIGWWRARFTQIHVDPATHALTSKASPIGMLVILGLFAVRYAIRLYAAENTGANLVSEALLAMTVGVVCAQRLEIFTRASRLLAEARATKPTSEVSS